MMDASVVADASVWVSWLITHDANHDATRLWMNRYISAGGLLVAPALVLIEVASAISRQTRQVAQAKRVAKDLSSLRTIRIVSLDTVLVWAAVKVAADLKLRAGDATYVAVAQQLKVPLVSWDKEQLQQGRNLIITYTPTTYTFEQPDHP
jgi:predicted nucleic acid-binding protein